MMTKWVFSDEITIDEWCHHVCSNCGSPACFDHKYAEDIDYDYDEQAYSRGIICTGIEEYITKYCPHCGEPMDCTEVLCEQTIKKK